MKKAVYFLICLFTFTIIGNAQNSEFKLQNYNPPSPTAFQFLKYDEMPVSEYTGIPNISIPIYQISEDGVSIPINLTYHAGGIRVNQEASWVGLGWDLNFGNIVQEINDRDDYDSQTIQMFPDFHDSPSPSAFPYRYNYPWTSAPGAGWFTPYPIINPLPHHSYKYATAYYFPINGDFDNQYNGQQVAANPYYDSEPDIFRASFLGHSISFIKRPNSSQIIVLNNTGYVVQRIGDTYKIIVPSGEQFYFEQSTTVQSYTNTFGGLGGAGSSDNLPSSRIWMITKIVTNSSRQILFNYTAIGSFNNYPGYSEKWDSLTADGSNIYDVNSSSSGNHSGYVGLTYTNLGKTYSYSTENRYFLSSISFLNGSINFYLSDRNDLLGGKKLDSVRINNSSQLIKSYRFNYSYFDGTSVGGVEYTPSNASLFGNANKLRLKLLSLQDNSGANYTFIYNSTLLPSKNSLAQDFWGFYNGQINNASLIPNPARLNKPELGNNGNNNSANLTYAQAGILTEIQYPTGGKVSFEYGLNQFDNYWVPDFQTTSNEISTGNGLRIQSISYKADGVSLSKKTIYSYEGGKGIVPLTTYRHYNIASVQLSSTISQVSYYLVDELCSKGFFSTNSLGSINGVGYSKVIQKDVDSSGSSDGRTETEFNNNPDIVSTSATTTSPLSIALPAIKNKDYPENGTVKTITYFKNYYDGQGTLQSQKIKKVENTYDITVSTYYYGARIFGCGNFIYAINLNSPPASWYAAPETFIGFYPIYDTRSLLYWAVTKEYSEYGDSLKNTIYYTYDEYDQLTSKETRTSAGGYFDETYEHAYSYYLRTGNNLLWNKHMLTEVTSALSQSRKSSWFQSTDVYRVDKNYSSFNNNIVVDTVTIKDKPDVNINPKIITYDQYDSSGNPLQITESGSPTSMVWDYNNQYMVAAVKNTTLSQIAYTSFESDGKGNWSYSGTPSADFTSPSGKKVYSLSNGSINKSQLSTTTSFIVSYWSKNGPQVVTPSGTLTSGRTVDSWTYFEHVIANPSTGSITISGSGTIDELRLYPKGSFMTSFIYQPLVGITSQFDVNNRSTYYEYDGAGRLIIIRDQDKNILKKFCYNYEGQPEGCGYYKNVQKSGAFTRNNCGSGYSGSTVTYTVPAETYISTYSQPDADQMAQNDVNANGQNYANNYGTCILNNVANVISSNWKPMAFAIQITNGSSNYNFTTTSGQMNAVLGQIPYGTYDITVFPLYNTNVSYSCTINGGYYSSGVGTKYFYNISVPQDTNVAFQFF